MNYNEECIVSQLKLQIRGLLNMNFIKLQNFGLQGMVNLSNTNHSCDRTK